MNILLTGPTGFIGRTVLRQALAAGHEVTALVFPGESLPEDWRSLPRLHLCQGTLAAPPWPDLLAHPLELCLHTAWITTPGIYLESEENDRFLEWSVKLSADFYTRGGRYFMGLGSCAEYVPVGAPLREDTHPLNASTRYARCKNTLRLALEKLAKEHDASAGWGRVFYPFGIGEHPARLFSSLILKLSRREPVVLKTPQSTKDYIYIEDLAGAILMALEQRCAGSLNLGTGQGITVREIATRIGALLGRAELVREADTPAVDPLDYMVADATRLRSFGWRETVGFERGLESLCRHLTEHHSHRPY